MTEARRAIVCLSHLNWDPKLFQRPQQLMLRFSRSFDVLFVNEPSFGTFVRDLFRGEKQGHVRVNDRLTVLTPFGMPRVLMTYGWLRGWNRAAARLAVKRRMRRSGISRPVLWLYHPRFLDAAGKLGEDLLVYDCMDDFSSLLSGGEDQTRNLSDEEVLLARADVAFAGGFQMAEPRKKIRADLRVFPSACDTNHFHKALAPETTIPADIRGIPSPILGYWGAIDERLDHDLLRRLAEENPDFSIVLLGPIVEHKVKDVSYLRSAKNVHWLGPKDYQSLPAYAKAFDICLNPFVLTRAGTSLSPTKTMEYLASGRPVISTPIPDVVRFYQEVVRIAEGPRGFAEAARELLGSDSAEARQGRIQFTDGKTWDRTAGEMEGIVRELLARRGAAPSSVSADRGAPGAIAGAT